MGTAIAQRLISLDHEVGYGIACEREEARKAERDGPLLWASW
jgi:hypothetical protein